jgi:hypothetical protein
VLYVSLRTLLRFFLSPAGLAALLVFLAASGALAGALPACDEGALPAVEAGLGAMLSGEGQQMRGPCRRCCHSREVWGGLVGGRGGEGVEARSGDAMW